MTAATMSEVSSFVEQDDQHYGVLTVRETIGYASRLTNTSASRAETRRRVDDIIHALGLQSCAGLKIGTPIQRGISGGQKRRVTVGTGLVTYPRVLFLDEPTSGLDSASAREVVASIRRIAQAEGIIVIATIHSPSVDTLQLFDQMMVLAKGRTAFRGTMAQAAARCTDVGHPMPAFQNPADHLLDLVASDFGEDKTPVIEALYSAQRAVEESDRAAEGGRAETPQEIVIARKPLTHDLKVVGVLCERTVLNYSRNLLAYGVRMGMYIGMGLMLATIWIRLGDSDGKINDRLSVHFFAVAFLAFMSVAGIPAFLEERSVFIRERRNGLYGPTPFLISNTLVSMPFLFACTLFFSLIVYWAIGLHPGAGHFWRFLSFLFLAIIVAEAQAQLIAGAVPIFIAALALSAFVNGFWMCVQGYFIRARSLPRFWYYSFHFMDYQTFSFEILAKNDLLPDGSCQCTYPPSAATIAEFGQCKVSGADVLQYLGYGGIPVGGYAGILVGIFVLYRVFLWALLKIRR
jgi:ABC-type multidrug transport system ATPase subunit